MAWITLHSPNGSEVIIQSDHIVRLRSAIEESKAKCTIDLSGSQTQPVTETVSEVLAMIKTMG